MPLDASNLVWKAAAALWTALGRAGEIRDAVIQIDKKIPVEAGLGGGSSDAAAALMALGRLWGGAPITLLREVGATIGADVPFFLSGGTALGLGPRRRDLPARRSPAALRRHRPAAVRRVDRRGLRAGTTRTGAAGAATRTASSSSCRCPGRAGRRRWSTTSSRR